MFTEMGWLDSSYNFDNVTAETDVLSLPANVNINTNFQTVYKVEREGVAVFFDLTTLIGNFRARLEFKLFLDKSVGFVSQTWFLNPDV